MEHIQLIKTGLLTACGIAGSLLLDYFGGFDHLLRALVILMAVDFITGFLVAAYYKRSQKTECGKLSSPAAYKGIIKKCCILLMVVVAVLLDGLISTNGLTRDAVIIAFILNELISILENAGLMGVKLPSALTNALEVLSKERPVK